MRSGSRSLFLASVDARLKALIPDLPFWGCLPLNHFNFCRALVSKGSNTILNIGRAMCKKPINCAVVFPYKLCILLITACDPQNSHPSETSQTHKSVVYLLKETKTKNMFVEAHATKTTQCETPKCANHFIISTQLSMFEKMCF